MLETRVTQAMWESVMGDHRSWNSRLYEGKSKNYPVDSISWYDCQKYIEKLKDKDISPEGYRFSLPTASQWEYACRAGATSRSRFWSAMNGERTISDEIYPFVMDGKYMLERTEGWCSLPDPANAWGLREMHGTYGGIGEWCSDWFGKYPSGDVIDPTGSSTGKDRVIQLGGWDANVQHCRTSYGWWGIWPSRRNYDHVLRLSLIAKSR